ncbi:MAG TPA: heme exporter protein CcmD [Casimicrobiaceae bacterium]|nr:heme exporter protein CcmD [Casimicrobiaceae bacterium]
MSEFFAMGGYAWYVWMSYGAAAVAVIVEVAALRLRRRRAFDDARIAQDSDAADAGSQPLADLRSNG